MRGCTHVVKAMHVKLQPHRGHDLILDIAQSYFWNSSLQHINITSIDIGS